jgi:hypothetical protein
LGFIIVLENYYLEKITFRFYVAWDMNSATAMYSFCPTLRTSDFNSNHKSQLYHHYVHVLSHDINLSRRKNTTTPNYMIIIFQLRSHVSSPNIEIQHVKKMDPKLCNLSSPKLFHPNSLISWGYIKDASRKNRISPTNME